MKYLQISGDHIGQVKDFSPNVANDIRRMEVMHLVPLTDEEVRAYVAMSEDEKDNYINSLQEQYPNRVSKKKIAIKIAQPQSVAEDAVSKINAIDTNTPNIETIEVDTIETEAEHEAEHEETPKQEFEKIDLREKKYKNKK